MPPLDLCQNCRPQFIIEDYISPVPDHLLQTNDPPSTEQQSLLLNSLEESRRELQNVNETIAHIETALQALQRRRRGIEHSFMINKSVLSAMRRLPREVLAAIFIEAIDEPKISLDMRDSIWSLSRVCRIWREVALSLSGVWCNIDVRYEQSPQPKHPEQILKFILRCTRGKPASINLRISRFSASATARQLLDMAIEHSHIWRDATIDLPLELLPRLRKLAGRVPLLETINLSHSHYEAAAASAELGQAFSIAPALHSITLGAEFDNPGNLDIPWSQLRHFDYARCINNRPSLLRKMPNLSSLILHNDYEPTDIEHLVLDDVRSLCCSPFPDYPPYLLKNLTLPALEVVENVNSAYLGILLGLVRRSGCFVKDIHLIKVRRDALDDLTSLFELTPALLTLRYHEDDIQNLLPVFSKNSPVLPQLHEVHLRMDSLLTGFDDVVELIRVLQIRQQPVRKVVFDGDPPYWMTEEMMEWKENCAKLIKTFGGRVEVIFATKPRLVDF